MKEVLRQEKKYLLSYPQFSRLDSKFDQLLHPDEHNGREGYMIRSLYFDTMGDMDFNEKMDGLEVRRKIRLRIYSPDDDYAKLEMKQKQGENQKKRSLTVSREDAMQLSAGRYSCLLNYDTPFAKELYGIMNVRAYRPKAIVEYNRKAYVAKENNTRVTFDSKVRATESNFNLFDDNLLQYQVMDPYLVIMEVKFNSFMLSYIKDLISMEGKSPLSVSKYMLSRTVSMHYLF